jgi:hypothetical protein
MRLMGDCKRHISDGRERVWHVDSSPIVEKVLIYLVLGLL